MAKQITQRIALEGGDQVRAGLKNLGTTGQEAFKSVQDAAKGATTAAIQLAPVIDAVQKKLGDLKKSANEVGESWDHTKEKFTSFGERIAVVGAAIGGLVFEFIKTVTEAGEAAAQIKRMADGLGLTTQQYQRLTFAANAFGIGQEALQKVLTRMDSKIAETNKGYLEQDKALSDLQKKLAFGTITYAQYQEQVRGINESNANLTNVFQRLGISIYDTSKATQAAGVQIVSGVARWGTFNQTAKDLQRPLADNHTMLMRLAAVFPTLDDSMKAVIATELGFSRNKSMVNFLNQGVEGIKRMEAEAERVAPSLTKFQIAVGEKLEEAMKTARAAMDSVSESARLMFAPDVTRLLEAFTEMIVNNRARLIDYAVSLRDKIAPIIDDVVKLLEGHEIDPTSVVGRLKAGIEQFVADVKEAAVIVAGAWNVVVGALDVVARIINSIFGTELTGQALAIVAVLATLSGVVGALASVFTLVFTVVGALATVFGGLNLAIAAVGVALGYVLGTLFLDILKQAKTGFDGWVAYFTENWQALTNFIPTAFSDAMALVSGAWTGFKNLVLDGIAAIKNAFAGIAAKFGFGGGAGNDNGGNNGFAGGGHIIGPGTGTSDSIPIWASNGEFMLRAKAVQHYGVSFLARLNALQLPKFSAGGLVDGFAASMSHIMPRNHFADGGLVTASVAPATSGRPVYVQIGDATFGPMTAAESTVSGLERYAANRQARSAGRKPTWSGNR